jgi:hypothetical protein
VQSRAINSLEAEHATTTLEGPKLLKVKATYPRKVLLGDIIGLAARADKEKEPEGEFRKAL